MKRLLLAGVLVASAIALPSSAVTGDPIPGIDVSIEQSPGGIIIAQSQTDQNGVVKGGVLAPGTYVVRMTQPLVTASDPLVGVVTNPRAERPVIAMVVIRGGQPREVVLKVQAPRPARLEVRRPG